MVMGNVILSQFLYGATFLASGIIGLFFLRFWKDTRDRFFLLFACAFFLMSAERLVLATMQFPKEELPYAYTIRLAAFLLILVAILHKNLGSKPRA